MCGIAGIISDISIDRSHMRDILSGMADSISHRGPDSSGIWIDPEIRVGFAHRRLSIIDISDAGHQPMVSSCGRYVLTYNGEIYNHNHLRKELGKSCLGISWKGHSDTEVLLEAISRWGIRKTLVKVNGMFAFALWDREASVLSLARDRFGEKPLYYGQIGKGYIFASELKAFNEHPEFNGELDQSALHLYFKFGYIPGENSIYSHVSKVLPGTYISIKNGESTDHVYYSIGEEVIARGTNNLIASEESALEELDSLLGDSVAMRMEADVPLGAFLSGGIDSSLIVALMQAKSNRTVNTFTVGFNEAQFDEASHAKLVAKHLGTAHTEIYLDPAEALKVVPLLPELYDEPFSDESQIPTYLVSQMAREHVTVCLSGDGGDEIFGGYNRYLSGGDIWRSAKRLPFVLRRSCELMHRQLSRHFGTSFNRLIQSWLNRQITQEQLSKIMRVVGARDSDDVYWRLLYVWENTPLNTRASSLQTVAEDALRSSVWHSDLSGMCEKMMAADLNFYLPDDILVKNDRAAMGVSLEGRIPMLDHRIVEFGWRLPVETKIRGSKGKWPLRQLLHRYVPKDLVERPKMGFSVPIAQWLRGPLRDWAEALIDRKKLREQGLFNENIIRSAWSDHLKSKSDNSQKLWTILMFQAWYNRWH